MGFLLARPARSRLPPYAVGAVTALITTVPSGRSGASVNPSRQFGPALFADGTGLLWAHLLAPMAGAVAGAVAGAGAHRLLRCCLHIPRPCTHRMCGQDAGSACR
ncbi:aquaporin [Actinacidiphila sp. bgisy160]|uniref:aquaporin n=1 Tax=Actinacidiphila sp. bgisy160 TaxID=3413796 RepID=UPI003D75F4D8